MNEELLKIADGLLIVADSIREMVKKGAESPAPEETGKKDNRQEDMAKPEQQQISIEDVRAVLAAKSQDGKTREVKALLMKYDAGKLSGVKPEDYPMLLKEAEAL